MGLRTLLTWIHVSSNLVWIGSLLTVAVILGWAAGEDPVRGALGHWLQLRLSLPAMVLSLLAGVGHLSLEPMHFLSQPWMHAKLTMVVAVLVIHHLVGSTAKKLANGEHPPRRRARVLALAFAVTAILAAMFVITRVPGAG